MVLANLAVRFIVELLGLAFVGYCGFMTSGDTVVRVVLGIGAIAVFAVAWGLFLAPNATTGLTRVQKDTIGTIVLLVAAVALAAAGQPTAAVAYAAVVVANAGLLLLLADDVVRLTTSFGPRG